MRKISTSPSATVSLQRPALLDDGKEENQAVVEIKLGR